MMLPNVSFSALPASLGGPLVIDDSLTACFYIIGVHRQAVVSATTVRGLASCLAGAAQW